MEKRKAARRGFCGNGEKCRNDNGKDALGSGAGCAGSIDKKPAGEASVRRKLRTAARRLPQEVGRKMQDAARPQGCARAGRPRDGERGEEACLPEGG